LEFLGKLDPLDVMVLGATLEEMAKMVLPELAIQEPQDTQEPLDIPDKLVLKVLKALPATKALKVPKD
jgi:hypothetical protein